MFKKGILIIYVVVLLSGCHNNDNEQKRLDLKEKELELKERDIELREKELKKPITSSAPEEPGHNNRTYPIDLQGQIVRQSSGNDNYIPHLPKPLFVFAMVETDEPKTAVLPSTSKQSTGSLYSGGQVPDPIETPTLMAEDQFYKYTSDITRIEAADRDKQYLVMEKFENSVLQNLKEINLNTSLKDNEHVVGDMQARIIYKKIFVFDTYKAAMEKRDQLRYHSTEH